LILAAGRVVYGYRKNGTRGFVHTLSVSRAPADCKLFAYTADRIATHVQSEFTAVTDMPLQPDHNERHRFVRDTLRDANIQFFGYECFRCVGAKADQKAATRTGRFTHTPPISAHARLEQLGTDY